MGLLFLYNVESVRARWRTTLVAILGIAGTVGVFVAMLALAQGFEVALVTSGSPEERHAAAGGGHLRDRQLGEPRAVAGDRGRARGGAGASGDRS